MTGISIFLKKGFGLAQYLEGLYFHFFNHENCNIFFVDSRYLSSKQEVIMVFIGYSPTGRGPSILMQFIKAQRFHLGACGNGSKWMYSTMVYIYYMCIQYICAPFSCFVFHIFWRSWLSLCLVSFGLWNILLPFYSSANISHWHYLISVKFGWEPSSLSNLLKCLFPNSWILACVTLFMSLMMTTRVEEKDFGLQEFIVDNVT